MREFLILDDDVHDNSIASSVPARVIKTIK